jgi:hypothetical protein
LVCISASSAQQQCRGRAYIIVKSSINRQSTVHQIPRARSIKSSVALMLFMGLVCNTIGQLPPAFLVPRPTRHMSHESTDNVCCRRTTDYCHATGHHQSTTTPARSSATILILHLFQGCTWRRKHCGRRPAGGSGSGSIASLFHPAECPPRALKTQSQRQSRGMTIGKHIPTPSLSQ